MQDLDKTKCESIPTGTEGRLIDKRDNKVYWVGKIRNSTDNEALCWMTQNLDYDGGSVAGYSGSDVATLTAGTSFTTGTVNNAQYYDPGEYIYTYTYKMSGCNDQSLSNSLRDCEGWVLKDSLTNMDLQFSYDPDFYTSTSYTSADGKMICTKEADSWVGDINSTYIPCRMAYYTYPAVMFHYSVGNYYSWMAATNKTGTSALKTDGAEASGSICPLGWKLPLGGNKAGSNNTVDGSFYKLLNALPYTQWVKPPYYYVYSGHVGNSTISYISGSGHYWSSIANTSTSSYAVVFSDTGDGVSDISARFQGFSVRCVAR